MYATMDEGVQGLSVTLIKLRQRHRQSFWSVSLDCRKHFMEAGKFLREPLRVMV
jgi:hypothetical protein